MTDAPVRSIAEIAIDNALIRHMSKLFDVYATDLELELQSDPEELSRSKTPSATARFEKKFDVAMFAHSEMISAMKRKGK